MSPEEFRKHGHQVVDWIAEYLGHIRDYRVVPQCKPGDLMDALPASAPDKGEPMERILADFEKEIISRTTHWNHPRFHSFFSVSSSPPSMLAESLIAAVNMQHMLWKSGPAGTELELITLDWLRQWMGLKEKWFGEIFDTASVSTLHAIAAAREQACPEARQEGQTPNLVLYCSEFAHSSVDKAAIMLGLGLKNVRKIPADSEFRMRPELLAKAIQEDRATGLLPFCVVPTVGTTGVTSVDPVPEIVEIAHDEGLWVHVDAAYGGAAAIVPEYRHWLDGVDKADSLVVNPHKWVFTSVDLSAFYTRKPEIVRRAFSLTPEYLKYGDDPRQINLMDYGLPLGRRFRSLKLWFVMRYYGHAGVTAIIRNHIQWAKELADEIAADGRFEIMAPTTMSLIVFRLKVSDEENQRLVEAINDSGFAFLSHTILREQFVIRWAVGNYQTRREDLWDVWNRIKATVETVTRTATAK